MPTRYVEQLVGSAEAAVEEVIRRAVSIEIVSIKFRLLVGELENIFDILAFEGGPSR